MNTIEKKNHWNNIYKNKNVDEVSWYQPIPKTSLEYVKGFDLPKTAKIIDVGGGDSFFVDHLLNLGFQNVTVLDISKEAIEKAKKRLGKKAAFVKWIVSDVTKFEPTEVYDLWHDRAVFHFLTEEKDVKTYLQTISIESRGMLVIGAFSEDGPKKCSGIDIKQYSVESMTECMKPRFNLTDHKIVNHHTPFDTVQNFVFCSFTPELQF